MTKKKQKKRISWGNSFWSTKDRKRYKLQLEAQVCFLKAAVAFGLTPAQALMILGNTTRELLIALLDDEHGVNSNAFELIKKSSLLGDYVKDIFRAVKETDGRF